MKYSVPLAFSCCECFSLPRLGSLPKQFSSDWEWVYWCQEEMRWRRSLDDASPSPWSACRPGRPLYTICHSPILLTLISVKSCNHVQVHTALGVQRQCLAELWTPISLFRGTMFVAGTASGWPVACLLCRSCVGQKHHERTNGCNAHPSALEAWAGSERSGFSRRPSWWKRSTASGASRCSRT
jgi:hypothetical protein